jgi:hypothetical protein
MRIFAAGVLLLVGAGLVATTTAGAHDKKTPAGNDMKHEHPPPYSEAEKEAERRRIAEEDEKYGERRKKIGEPTRDYNCCGHVMCNRTSFLSKQGALEWLLDSGYKPINLVPGRKPKRGDLVIYKTGTQLQHVGIVEEVDADGKVKKVQSKWGTGGEFSHDMDAVPAEYGNPVVYVNH